MWAPVDLGMLLALLIILCQGKVEFTYLRQGLVAAVGLATIQVGVDPGVGLVQHVLLVGTSRVRGRTRSGAEGGGTRTAGSVTVVTVRVYPRVGGVGHTAVVLSVRAGRVVVAGHTSTSRAVTGVVVRTAVIAVRVDAGVGSIGSARTVGSVDTLGVIVARDTVGASVRVVGGVSGVTSRVADAAGGARRVTQASGVAAVVAVRVDARVGSVGHTRTVGSVDALRVVVARGGGVRTSGRVGAVVTVAVKSGVGGIGNAAVVSSVGTLRKLVGLVTVDGLLNLVDESRHVGWCLCVGSCRC